MQSKNIAADQDKRSFIETARRAQIIECAVEAFADLGFAQTSLAQIAKRAKVSTGVILYYFAGKDELIGDVVAHVFATGEGFIRPKVAAQGEDPRKALAAFIEASVGFIASNPKYVLAVMNIMRAGAPRPGPCVSTRPWSSRAKPASARSSSGASAKARFAPSTCA